MRKTKVIRSDEEIAREFRRRLGVDHKHWLDPITILTKLRHIIPRFNFATVASGEIWPALARWDSDSKLISISDQTYAAANRAEGRARFTILHEAMHVLSGHKGEFNRLPGQSEIPFYAHKLRAMESGTNRITAAFMAPRHRIQDGWSAREVAFFFGMSFESAQIRLEEIRRNKGPGK